jgi:hypothetical protein
VSRSSRVDLFSTPKVKNSFNKNISEQQTKAKEFHIGTPFNGQDSSKVGRESTAVKIKFKDENMNNFQENRLMASKTIEKSTPCKRVFKFASNGIGKSSSSVFSPITSISHVTESFLLGSNFQSNFSLSDGIAISTQNESTCGDTNVRLNFDSETVMNSIYYNHSKIPVGKEYNEVYKVKLINRDLKPAKEP